MSDTVSLPIDAFGSTELYFLLRDTVMPRPIAWVSSMDADGRVNLAPYSFFNVCCPKPAILGFSCGPRGRDKSTGGRIPKDTSANIRVAKEFVVNIVPELLTEKMVMTSDDLPPGENEFVYAGLESAPSTTVKPPRVAGAPIAYECTLHSIQDLGSNFWVMGTVTHVHIARAVYVGKKGNYNHRVDLMADLATRPVGRLGRAEYARLREIEVHLRGGG